MSQKFKVGQMVFFQSEDLKYARLHTGLCEIKSVFDNGKFFRLTRRSTDAIVYAYDREISLCEDPNELLKEIL